MNRPSRDGERSAHESLVAPRLQPMIRPSLLNDLVRPRQQRRWNREAEGLRRLQVDHELKLVGCSTGKSLAWRPAGFSARTRPRACDKAALDHHVPTLGQ